MSVIGDKNVIFTQNDKSCIYEKREDTESLELCCSHSLITLKLFYKFLS